MRLTGFAIIALTGVFVATHAQASGVTFGGFACPQHIPCEQSNAAFPTLDNLIASTNACVQRNVGIPTPANGFFDQNMGLDANGCLSTISESFASLGALRSIPQCCVKALPTGSGCVVSCTMVGQ